MAANTIKSTLSEADKAALTAEALGDAIAAGGPEHGPDPTPLQAEAALVGLEAVALSGEELTILQAALLGWASTLRSQLSALHLELKHPVNTLNPRPTTYIQGDIAITDDMLHRLAEVATRLGIEVNPNQ